jgi:hypothetical protein
MFSDQASRFWHRHGGNLTYLITAKVAQAIMHRKDMPLGGNACIGMQYPAKAKVSL